MIFHIVKKEVLENLLSLRFAITCLLCFLVVTASIVIMGKEYADDYYEYTRNKRKHREEVEKMWHPWQIIYRGITVDKPVVKLTMFNKGIDDSGKTAKLIGAREPEYYTKRGKNPVAYLFPAIDLLFFVAVIMSLLAIVFSYDAISGEKFNETLKLMVSYPVSRDSIIIGKWLGGYICLMVPFVLSAIAGLAVLFLLLPDMELTREEIIRVMLLFVLSGVFISIVYTFGIAVSANTENPASSITALLLVWVVFILIVPNISSSIASVFVKTENIQEFEGKKRKVMIETHRKVRRKVREYRKKHKVRWRDPGLQIYRQKLRKQIYKERRSSLENIERRFLLKLNKQIELAKWISRLSPLASLKYAAGLLTQSGYREDYDFRKAVDEYQKEVVTFGYDEWQAQNEDRYRVSMGQQKEEQWEFSPERAPVFDYGKVKRSNLDNDVADGVIDLGLLLFWNILFFMIAYVSFMRYDVK